MASFTEFCASLGCSLTNQRWSWAAISQDGRRIVFTVWTDEVDFPNRRYTLHPVAQRRPGEIPDSVENKLGAGESERFAKLAAADPTIEVLGVLCFAQDPAAGQRQRTTFDDRTVYRLRVEQIDGKLIAQLVDRPEVRGLPKK